MDVPARSPAHRLCPVAAPVCPSLVVIVVFGRRRREQASAVVDELSDRSVVPRLPEGLGLVRRRANILGRRGFVVAVVPRRRREGRGPSAVRDFVVVVLV